ncbi:MAG: 50S ribosomal protein L18 [Candidatus Moeniiplasma glomeromycotorum]|nr:50S ribosomal protein L18 [Candidatus Moeniiplasma glomeromycotorum]MCE8167028.1 50S ribosomal protein L18 [Candidatus Moeniiplasma glomeromycotorum]MCE8168960.1 50S ribosomal protein L18 [Candidatus Moeniiplasma glomeromycotorum]
MAKKKIIGTIERPRTTFKKSNRFLTVQGIDDTRSHTLVYASTANWKSNDYSRKNKTCAQKLAIEFAQKLKSKAVEKIVFDRHGYPYHGVVQVFCETLRENKINF